MKKETQIERVTWAIVRQNRANLQRDYPYLDQNPTELSSDHLEVGRAAVNAMYKNLDVNDIKEEALREALELIRKNQNEVCSSCGHPKNDHNFRHPFVSSGAKSPEKLIQSLIDLCAQDVPEDKNATNYNDGKWHGWNGGECPVHPESTVEVIFSNASKKTSYTHKASNVYWENGKGLSDIVAFRVIKAHPSTNGRWFVRSDAFASAEKAREWMEENGLTDLTITYIWDMWETDS